MSFSPAKLFNSVFLGRGWLFFGLTVVKSKRQDLIDVFVRVQCRFDERCDDYTLRKLEAETSFVGPSKWELFSANHVFYFRETPVKSCSRPKCLGSTVIIRYRWNKNAGVSFRYEDRIAARSDGIFDAEEPAFAGSLNPVEMSFTRGSFGHRRHKRTSITTGSSSRPNIFYAINRPRARIGSRSIRRYLSRRVREKRLYCEAQKILLFRCVRGIEQSPLLFHRIKDSLCRIARRNRLGRKFYRSCRT